MRAGTFERRMSACSWDVCNKASSSSFESFGFCGCGCGFWTGADDFDSCSRRLASAAASAASSTSLTFILVNSLKDRMSSP